MTDWKTEDQVTFEDLGLWSGKTSTDHSVQTEDATSRKSSRKSSGSPSQTPPMCLCLTTEDGLNPGVYTKNWGGGQLLGAYMTRSFGEYPNEENESLLSQILEDSPHPKYNLSAKACLGILNRARKRGKKLPEILEAALIRQSATASRASNPMR